MMSYEDPADNEGDAVIKNFNNKDKVYIYLNFGTIGIFKIEVEVRMFVFYNCLNWWSQSLSLPRLLLYSF